ncbi:MAG: ASCH domain-containing protein [Promethearchaeota archaeon]
MNEKMNKKCENCVFFDEGWCSWNDKPITLNLKKKCQYFDPLWTEEDEMLLKRVESMEKEESLKMEYKWKEKIWDQEKKTKMRNPIEMAAVILSIKPKYVKSILNGTKKFEFRKKIFKRKEISEILIYSSSPVQKIVGGFEIGRILKDTPENLWNTCKEYAGIGKDEFFNYFKDKRTGFAIEIKKLKIFSKKINPYEIIPDFHPPQSFCYYFLTRLERLEFVRNMYIDARDVLSKASLLNSIPQDLKKEMDEYVDLVMKFER